MQLSRQASHDSREGFTPWRRASPSCSVPPMLKPKTETKNAKQLMKNQILIGGTILMLAAVSAWGAENVSSVQGLQYDQGDSYRANELSLDAFGTASLGRYTIENWSASRARHNGQLGAG